MTKTHAANAATTTAKLADVIIAAIVNAVNYIQMCSVIENWGGASLLTPKERPRAWT